MVLVAVESGTPLDRIALLSRHDSPYAALAAGQLAAAGIPWNGQNPRTLAQMAAGRTLLGLLELSVTDFARSAVSAWLGASPIRHHILGQTVPAYRWAEIARQAGIVRGRAEWVTGLERHRERLQRELEGHENGDDPAEWRSLRAERGVEQTRELIAFMDELFGLVDHASEGNWTSFAQWAQDLVARYIGTEASLAARLPQDVQPDAEIDAYRVTIAALESLAELAEVGARVNLATFRRVLQRELDRPARRIGRFGEGVFVGRLADALGTDFDHVFVLGMNEGTVPARGLDDALIPQLTLDGEDSVGQSLHQSRSMRHRLEEPDLFGRARLCPTADSLGGAGGSARSAGASPQPMAAGICRQTGWSPRHE